MTNISPGISQRVVVLSLHTTGHRTRLISARRDWFAVVFIKGPTVHLSVPCQLSSGLLWHTAIAAVASEYKVCTNHNSAAHRLNKCGVISPRYDVRHGDIETWIAKLLPSRLVRSCHGSRHVPRFQRLVESRQPT